MFYEQTQRKRVGKEIIPFYQDSLQRHMAMGMDVGRGKGLGTLIKSAIVVDLLFLSIILLKVRYGSFW